MRVGKVLRRKALVQHAVAQSSRWENLESRTLLSASPSGLTPADVLTAYGFNKITFTNSKGQAIAGNGAGQTIAIVDPYVSSTIASDLNTFDKQFDENGSQSLYAEFGAASSFFTATNLAARATSDAGWALETALDVEWAHAIAPAAKIDLVEAVSANTTDLLNAVSYAAKLPGVSVVSMSWGGSEFSGENTLDSYFTTPSGHQGVTFVAAAGDSAGTVSWPAVSDNVLAVGGTSLNIGSGGAYLSETGWNSGGGGLASLEAEPSYQASVNTTGLRSTPDVAYDADPNTGFSVYTATAQNGQVGWFTVGGTSAGAPQWSALVAIANQGRVLAGKATLDGATQTLPSIYDLPAGDFHDITSGNSGFNQAGPGYDPVTGRGSPIANLVVGGLVNSTTTTPIGTIGATGNNNAGNNTGNNGGTSGNGPGNPGGGGGSTGGTGGSTHHRRQPPPPPPPVHHFPHGGYGYGYGYGGYYPYGWGWHYAVVAAPVAVNPLPAAKTAVTAIATEQPNQILEAEQVMAADASVTAVAALQLQLNPTWSQTPIIVADDSVSDGPVSAGAAATDGRILSQAVAMIQAAPAALPVNNQQASTPHVAPDGAPRQRVKTMAATGSGVGSAVLELPLAALLLLGGAGGKRKRVAVEVDSE